MTVQVRPDDPKRRRFNPERDLVWMLPRIMKRGLMTFGILTEPKLKQILVESGLGPDAADTEDFKVFIDRLSDFMGAAANPEENSDEAVRKILGQLYELPPAIRLLAFDRIMKVILAEYPVWCEQVRPESTKDPRPPVEEIEQARDALLEQLPG